MNNHQIDIFEYRQSIIDNAGKLIDYGKKAKKSASTGQLSLFGTDTVEVEKVDIFKSKLSQYELLEIAKKEIDAIGLPITYDEFDEYFLIEKTLCDSTVNDAFFCQDNGKVMTLLANVVKTEVRTSKAGNKYAKIFIDRNGVEIKLYLFGTDWQRTYQSILVNQIHIIRINYNNELYSIKKIDNCNLIDVNQYIDSIDISIPTNRVSQVSAYLVKDCVLKGKTKINFIVKDRKYESIWIGYLNSQNCIDLIDLGCKININRIR